MDNKFSKDLLNTNAVSLGPTGKRIEIQKRPSKNGNPPNYYWNWRWQYKDDTGMKKRGYKYGGPLASIPDINRLRQYSPA